MSARNPEPPAELEAAQRLLRALVTAPTGVRPALAGEAGVDGWLDAWRDPAAALDGTVRSDPRLDAAARLDVYAQGYFARLHDVLLEDFPTVAWLCGEAVFHDLVTAFLVAHPSRSPSLRDLGRPFSAFLASHPVAAFGRAKAPGIEDVARLEWAFTEVFDAPDAPTLERVDLARLEPERWAEMSLACVASFELHAFEWPVSEAVSAHRRGAVAPERRTEPSHVAVWRAGERAVFRALDAHEAEALHRVMRGGAVFGDVCEVAAANGADAAEAAARAAGWLAGWVGARWLTPLPEPSGVR